MKTTTNHKTATGQGSVITKRKKTGGRQAITEIEIAGIFWQFYTKGKHSSQDIFIHPVTRDRLSRRKLQELSKVKKVPHNKIKSMYDGNFTLDNYTSNGDEITGYISGKVYYPKSRLKFEDAIIREGLQLKCAYALLHYIISESGSKYNGEGVNFYQIFVKPSAAIEKYRHDYGQYIKVFLSLGLIEVFAPYLPKVHSTIYKVFIHDFEYKDDDSGEVYGFQIQKCEDKIHDYTPKSFKNEPIPNKAYYKILNLIKPHFYCVIRNDKETLLSVLRNLKARLKNGIPSKLTVETVSKIIKAFYTDVEKQNYSRWKEHKYQYENDEGYQHHIDVVIPAFLERVFSKKLTIKN